MASPDSTHATLCAHQLLAMTDTELHEFIENSRQPDGDYHLPVEGWTQLSEDERLRLAARLQSQGKGISKSPTLSSHPLDLEELDARLLRVAADQDVSSQNPLKSVPQSEPPTPPSPFDPIAYRKSWEALFYHDLVNDKGRPLYPIDLLDEIFANPGKHHELIRPWRSLSVCGNHERVIQSQWSRWRDFRRWQNDNRGREDDDGGYPAFVEQQKRWNKQDYPTKAYAEFLAELEADPLCLMSDWESNQEDRRRHRYLFRERGCKGFHDYDKAVKDRLTRHGFTLPFALNEDPKKQDEWTTWVEYLGYESWWLDNYRADIKRLQPAYEQAYQELVASKMVKAHETPESVRSFEAIMIRDREAKEAERRVERLRANVRGLQGSTQGGRKHSQVPKSKQTSILRAFEKTLLDAIHRSEWIKKRNERIAGFVRSACGYVDAKKNECIHRTLVQWVLEQVPLIETKMSKSKDIEARLDGNKPSKRKLASDDESSEPRRSKKRKLYHHATDSQYTRAKPTDAFPKLDIETDEDDIGEITIYPKAPSRPTIDCQNRTPMLANISPELDTESEEDDFGETTIYPNYPSKSTNSRPIMDGQNMTPIPADTSPKLDIESEEEGDIGEITMYSKRPRQPVMPRPTTSNALRQSKRVVERGTSPRTSYTPRAPQPEFRPTPPSKGTKRSRPQPTTESAETSPPKKKKKRRRQNSTDDGKGKDTTEPRGDPASSAKE